MKVEINVDETQFAELLESRLSVLSDEDVKELIVKSIEQYFIQNNYERIENLFIETKYRYGFKEKCATPFLEKLVKDCDYFRLQKVLDAAIDNLIEHNSQILKDMFIEAIASSLSRTFSFQDSVRSVLYDIKSERQKN